MKTIINLWKPLLAFTICFGLTPQLAQAATQTYGFYSISNHNADDVEAAEAQLSVTVSEVVGNPNQVAFTFNNEGSEYMSITAVYFDDGTLLGIASLDSSAGVSFTQDGTGPNKVNPGNLPGGSSLDPPFETTAGFLADADNPGPKNGVEPGQWLTVYFDLKDDQTYENVLDAIAQVSGDGSLRIGIQVQGFDSKVSEQFVNIPPDDEDDDVGLDETPVPEPASIFLFGLGTLGMGALARRRRQTENLPRA